MRIKVHQTEAAGKMFWIAYDTEHPPWFYHGPFSDEAAAHAFARFENRENFKKLLRRERARKAEAKMAKLASGLKKAA